MLKLQVVQKLQTQNSSQIQLAVTSDDTTVSATGTISVSVTPEQDTFIVGNFYDLNLQNVPQI